MQYPVPNEDFVQALASTPLLHNALPYCVSHFYREAKELNHRFANDDTSLPLYIGLVPVFHPHVVASKAALTKTRGTNFHPDFVYPLSPAAASNRVCFNKQYACSRKIFRPYIL
jgi:hypothetical protein